ncbi:IL-6 subfamily cytokine M17 isoform X2 [Pleuronectes platessa]|uniref:IL-6 subfamily cytokine M17 isoform X2 n=1 Tax=Pleuronectes platessa TaxID=8262 RepID=UPI00232A4A29|nr:IL-6 subfamily cytokine M17 isoform X2 [Pleuronectes platessa]
MNGRVQRMSFQQFMELTTTLLPLLLVMAVDSTRTVAASSSNQQCGNSLQQTLKLTRLAQKESVLLIKTYAAQGEMSELFCKVSVNDVPDPNISGLEPSERIASIYTHLQAFMAHFKRVYEQQTDLQLPSSPLLGELTVVSARSRDLAALMNGFYQSLFPNLPMPEPAGGPTMLPPPQNVFQQKVYGCAVLRTYKEFLSNVARELRTLKGKVCRRRMETNTFLLRMT